MACRREDRSRARTASRARQSAPFDLWRIRNRHAHLPRGSFPPCLTHTVDGIFRPGGGGLGDGFQDVPQSLPKAGKNWPRASELAETANGGFCLADEFILETHGLTKEFAGFFAVRDVALKVRRGSIHALIGPNGAGKTTCFNLLTKFLRPSAGQILYKGQDITAMAPADVARLGLVRSFQISAVFPHLTALENVRVALQRQHGSSFDFWRSKSVLDRFNSRAHELLNDVGLSEFAGTPAVEMPYGRKRALEIATTLALDPEMMLLTSRWPAWATRTSTRSRR